jgi:hypothetical protein
MELSADRQLVQYHHRGGSSSWGCAPPLSHVPRGGGCLCHLSFISTIPPSLALHSLTCFEPSEHTSGVRTRAGCASSPWPPRPTAASSLPSLGAQAGLNTAKTPITNYNAHPPQRQRRRHRLGHRRSLEPLRGGGSAACDPSPVLITLACGFNTVRCGGVRGGETGGFSSRASRHCSKHNVQAGCAL